MFITCCRDFEGKRQGVQGRVIKDDARKYPERTELTGGFAGGELGLKKFVELGDVPIAGKENFVGYVMICEILALFKYLIKCNNCMPMIVPSDSMDIE